MTAKADFDAEQWTVIANAPALAATWVMAAERGGTMRESVAMSRAYAEARTENDGELVHAILSTPPALDPAGAPKTPEDLQRDAPETLRRAVGLLEQIATDEEVVAYKRAVFKIADAVAHAHKEGGFLGIGGQEVSEGEQAVLDEIEAIFDQLQS